MPIRNLTQFVSFYNYGVGPFFDLGVSKTAPSLRSSSFHNSSQMVILEQLPLYDRLASWEIPQGFLEELAKAQNCFDLHPVSLQKNHVLRSRGIFDVLFLNNTV